MDTVLLIDANGENLGQRTMAFAERQADSQGLDLVEVRPGVYKIMNLGKLKYEASKRKQPKHKPLKEMKYTLNIGHNDYLTKTAKVLDFLKSGHTVKVTIWFTGREVNNPERGVVLMNAIAQDCQEFGDSNINAALQGKNMYMTITPAGFSVKK